MRTWCCRQDAAVPAMSRCARTQALLARRGERPGVARHRALAPAVAGRAVTRRATARVRLSSAEGRGRGASRRGRLLSVFPRRQTELACLFCLGRHPATRVQDWQPSRSALGLGLDDAEPLELAHGAEDSLPPRRMVESAIGVEVVARIICE